MIRFFDLIFSFIGLLLLFPILATLWILGYLKNKSPLFKQLRVGYLNKPFLLVKFRSMPINTKSVATHLVDTSAITPFGRFLRRTKLDEIPQLWNVLVGDMSLVGPRPCLFNQKKLISERKKRGVHKLKPGITGLAQILGITMKDPKILANTDKKMLSHFSIYYYFYYIIVTLLILLKIVKTIKKK